MIILKIIGIVAIVIAVLFILSLFIYFFNLDMKFAAVLIKPLTAYYNWSKNRREVKNVVCGTLMGMGYDVLNIGLATTPTTELMASTQTLK